jgi:fatty acid desaturase
MHLQPISTYARVLKSELDPELFKPNPKRAVWLPVHLLIIGASVALILSGVGGWPLALLLSVIIGHSYGCLGFLAHEAMHGSVVKSRLGKYLLGTIGFLPMSVSPRLWRAWHNTVHHGNTMIPGKDPDAFPELHQYEEDYKLRVADAFSPGRGRILQWVAFFLGFTIQSTEVLILAGRKGHMKKKEHRLAIAETLAAWAFWGLVAFAVGGQAFLFIYGIPLLIGNALVMGYILTNHNLSPLTEVNDPLVNSLSVTVPKFFDRLHLSFGAHTEHHLFPGMSPAHAHHVTAGLKRHWPERYQSMPLTEAIWRLTRTARVYKDHVTLHDPRTGRDFPALVPGARPSRPEPTPPQRVRPAVPEPV